MRAAEVAVAVIVERSDAAAARIRDATPRRDAVRPGERAEVGVEGTVLLHDHDHVLDLVDAARGPPPSPASRTLRARADERIDEHAEPERKNRSDDNDPLQPRPTLIRAALADS